MKFILLSNVATLAILAAAPEASAAGLRARANQHGGKDANADASTSSNARQDVETRGSSGRRKLYVRNYYFPTTETWHNNGQESQYMPDPTRDGTPYGMNIEGAPQGRSYAPYGLPSGNTMGIPPGMNIPGMSSPYGQTQYEPQVKTGPASVPVSEAVFSQYCKSLSDDKCSNTQGCSEYCPQKSAHVSEKVFGDYCRSLNDDDCRSTQGCGKYCVSSDIDEREWGHHNRNWFCGKIQTQDKCAQHDRDHQCGWDEHHYPPCHAY